MDKSQLEMFGPLARALFMILSVTQNHRKDLENRGIVSYENCIMEESDEL